MAATTSIEWTRSDDGTPGATWNPLTGCTKVSPGCDHCYAETFAERWRGTGGHYFENGFDVQLRPDKLEAPLRWRKPRRIFVNSMSDLFHSDVPDAYIAKVFAVMALTPRHTYQVLTKRHARMRSLLSHDGFHLSVLAETARQQDEKHPMPAWEPGARRLKAWPLPNVHLGVSVEDQHWADIRIPALLETPAAVRFLSCEPLLGPVDLWGPVDRFGGRRRLTYWLDGRPGWGPEYTTPTGLVLQDPVTAPRIDWVIVGGESGPGARPVHPDWARTLRDQCTHSGVPFLFKQWGEWGPMSPTGADGAFTFAGRHVLADDGTLYREGDLAYPDGPRYGEAIRAGHDRAHLTAMYRLGKKKAGRELDGATWDQFPKTEGNDV